MITIRPLLICALFMLALLCMLTPGFATEIPPPLDSGTNQTPNGDGSANPWDGSSSGDTPSPSRPPPGPCYEWEDGSPGDWIDQCKDERAAFIEAEKKLHDETKSMAESFDRVCGWWQDLLKKDFYSRINAAMTLSPLVCETLSGVAGKLPAGLPSAVTASINSASTGSALVETLMNAYNSFFSGLTAYQLEQLKKDIQKQMDDQARCLADLGKDIQNLKDNLGKYETDYKNILNDYKDALESFLDCCPKFEPEKIDPPDFNCPEPVFDPMVPQGLRLPC